MRGFVKPWLLLGLISAPCWAQDAGAALNTNPPPPDAGVALTFSRPDVPAASTSSSSPGDPANRPPPTIIEELFHGTELYTRTSHYEVAMVLGQGGLLYADGITPFPLNGFIIRERNGLLSYLLTVLAGQALSSLAIASSAVEISNVRSSESSSTRYNNDGSKTITTTTTTSASVKQLKTQDQVDRETDDANKSIKSGFVGHTFGELAIYTDLAPLVQPARPSGQGYELTFGGNGELFQLLGLPAVLDVGVHLANVRVTRPNSPGIGGDFLYHAAGGILGRLRVPVTRFATVSVEWILNFLSVESIFSADEMLATGRRPLSPLRLGLELYLTDHAFVRGEAVFGVIGVSDGRLGGSITAGVRL